jgi:soluble lytic murein transglycosylase-like protein
MELQGQLMRVLAERLESSDRPFVTIRRSGQNVAAGGGNPGSYDDIILAAAEHHGLDPALVKAVIKAESGFDPYAVSPAGAKGLMQLMDGTAAGLGISDPFDPAQNVDGGTRYLRMMLDRFGDIALALAAYNAGPGAVQKYGGIPPYSETRVYVPRVIENYQHYRNSLV